MGVYDRLIATATRMIRDRGESVTWESQSLATSPNPEKAWKGAETQTTPHTVNMVFLPYETIGREFLRYRKDSSVATGSEGGLMAQVDFTPTMKDSVIRTSNDKKYVVKNLIEYNPNGESILWVIEFKK